MSAVAHPPDGLISGEVRAAAFDLAYDAFDLVALVSLPELSIQFINPGGRRLLGLAPDLALEGLAWSDFVSSYALPAILYQAVPAAADGGLWRGDVVLSVRDGSTRPASLVMVGVGQGQLVRSQALVAAIDHSGTRQIESSLRQAQLLLDAVLDHTPDAVYFKDLQSRFIRVGTSQAARVGARNAEEVVGKSDFDYFDAAHAQAAYDDEQRIIASGEPVVDFVEKETWPDGHVTWVSSTKVPLREPRGRIIGTFGVSRDITARVEAEEERRRMEAHLQLAQKMESIGRLAAGVAHEVNTPTQFINDNTHFLVTAFQQLERVLQAYRVLRESVSQCPPCHAAARTAAAAEVAEEIDYLVAEIPKTLEQTLDGISRIARIVRSLKEFSHPNAPDKRPANINHAIETAVAVSRHEWKYVAEVSTELDPDLPSVPCVLDEFNQVMLNLIVNAAHAIGDALGDSTGTRRGVITVRTRVEGEQAVVEVSDTGTGIAPEHRARIFEPFFTTKAPGMGTGQGLAFVRSVIVTKHQGTVDFATEFGRGTTFRIELPIHPPPAPDKPPPA